METKYKQIGFNHPAWEKSGRWCWAIPKYKHSNAIRNKLEEDGDAVYESCDDNNDLLVLAGDCADSYIDVENYYANVMKKESELLNSDFIKLEKVYIQRSFSEEVDLKKYNKTVTLLRERYDDLSLGWNTDNDGYSDDEIFDMINE